MQDSALGRTIAGKYFIESSVGNGAMGTVYRARQLALDKTVALKVLRREFERNDEFVGRFTVEARAASKLDHPNSTRVIDFGREPDGLLYIAMEYLEGRDLYETMRDEGPFTAERTANIIAQALAAIAVAHEMGVLHRDLKPENIMLLHNVDDEGRSADLVKVCDFGIAKLNGSPHADFHSGSAPISQNTTKDSHRLTRMGLIMGTPAYMSPEQACGEELDARSDIYAIGVILYELLTGRVPFDAPTPEEIVDKHLSQEPPDPLDVNPHANPELAKIALRAMQKSPSARYATAREMRADIRSVLYSDLGFGIAPSGPLPLAASSQPRTTVETLTVPQKLAEPVRYPKPRSGRAAVIGIIGVLALGVGIGVTLLARQNLAHRATAVPVPVPTRVDSPVGKAEDPPATTEAKAEVQVDIVKHQGTAPPPPTTTPVVAGRGPLPIVRGRPGPHGVAPAAPPAPDPDPPKPAQATPAPLPPPPPPPAPVVATPDPPPPVPAPPPPPVAAPSPPPFDPARAQMSVGSISTDRMTIRDVQGALGRADLKSCYVASVRGGEPASPGTVNLALEVEELRVVRARASGASSSPSLRRCLESRLVGTRFTSADTGTATANIPLTFSSQ